MLLSVATQQKTQVPSEAAAAAAEAEEAAAVILRRELRLLRSPPSDVLRGSPQMRALLAVPPDEAPDRLFNLIAGYQLISALVLSGSLGFAFEPMNVGELPADRQTLGDIFNVLATILVVITVTHCCTLAWALAGVCSLTPATVHGAIARGTRLFVLQELVTGLALAIVIGMAVLSHWIHSSRHLAMMVTGICAGIFVLMITAWGEWSVQSMPVITIPWFGLPFPVGALPLSLRPLYTCALDGISTANKMEAQRQGDAMVRHAEMHLGRAVSLQPDAADANTAEATTVDALDDAEEQELHAFIVLALPRLSAEVVNDLVSDLLNERLTLSTLHQAADIATGGGASLLFHALELEHLELRHG